MSNDNFVHLHLHTEYSFLDGLSQVWNVPAKEPGDLPLRLKELGHKYCAITDHGSTSGWCKFAKALGKVGVEPVFGIEGYFCDDMNIKGLDEQGKLIATRGLVTAQDKRKAIKDYEKKRGLNKRSHFTCWAMNDEGIHEILHTQTVASTVGFYYRPRWDFSLIKEMKNCIFGTACGGGLINYWINLIMDKSDEPLPVVFKKAAKLAIEDLAKWKEELGDRLYVELQSIDWKRQKLYNKFSYEVAKHLDLPCYLANDSHYVNKEDWEVHDILLAIQSSYGIPKANALNDPNRLRYDMHDLYVKSRQEMYDSFLVHNTAYSESTIQTMLDNTMVIAERCTHKLIKKKMIMPILEIPTYIDENEDYHIRLKKYLLSLIKVGWKKKIVPYVSKDKWQEYKDRLKYELTEIVRQGFAPYFILVYRLMKWVDKKGIARGPARGSSAGSLVAYLLDITMIDPIPFRLLFSRFIDPNRTDFPDIDMDFEDRRRREIVQYFIDTYGVKNVSILGTNMTYKPKLALKDVARLYGVNLLEIQELCNLVVTRSGADSRLSFCLKDTFEQFDFAREFQKKYPKVAQFASKLEGRVCRCVSGDTIVKLRKGKLISVRDLHKLNWKCGHGTKVKIWDGDNGFTYSKVVNVFYNGRDSVMRVMAGKYKIVCTHNHKFLTKKGWKEICDIKVGEEVACNGIFVKGDIPWNKNTKGMQVVRWVKLKSKYVYKTPIDVYDIEVESEYHNYIANGFIVHNCGVHAAGVVIADGDMNKYTAMRRDKRQEEFLVSTIDKHDAEDLGLLKMDILGLNTMTILQEAKMLVKERHGVDINFEAICRDVAYNGGDSKVYEMFAKGETSGIFQFNSPGLTRLAKQVKIEKFSEISDCTALHRPGPIHSGAMNMYPGIKHGSIKKSNPLHKIVSEETDYTYGLVIYQEQVMQIVRKLGDFTWAQTNEIRKVMSKSGGAEYFMTHFWPPFKEGCAKKGINEKIAKKIFHRIMSFGSWAFNLSHSVSYALVSYLCMYFKVYYPIEFCTAFLNVVKDDEDIKHMITEIKRLGIKLNEPNVNVSKRKYVIHNNAIIANLFDIKNVGERAVQSIIENQPFEGLFDFINKVNTRACNRRSIQNLIKAGAFSDFGYDEIKLSDNLEEIMKLLKSKKGKEKAEAILESCTLTDKQSDSQDIAEMRKSVSPVYSGKHLVRYYDDIVAKFAPHVKITGLDQIEMDESKQGKVGKALEKLDVWLIGVFGKPDLKRLSQEVKEVIDKGEEQRYALANLEDDKDFIVLSFRHGAYTRYEQRLFGFKDKVMLIRGTVNRGWKKCYVDKLWVMDDVRSYFDSGMKPYDYETDYLFRHPVNKMFDKFGGIGAIRSKYHTVPLSSLKTLEFGKSVWSIGFITDIQTQVSRNPESKIYGKEWHWVFIEDDTFTGSFMIFPTDKRFEEMKADIFRIYESHMPVMIRIQRDMNFKDDDIGLKKVNMSIDKRYDWADMIKEPFVRRRA